MKQRHKPKCFIRKHLHSISDHKHTVFNTIPTDKPQRFVGRLSGSRLGNIKSSVLNPLKSTRGTKIPEPSTEFLHGAQCFQEYLQRKEQSLKRRNIRLESPCFHIKTQLTPVERYSIEKKVPMQRRRYATEAEGDNVSKYIDKYFFKKSQQSFQQKVISKSLLSSKNKRSDPLLPLYRYAINSGQLMIFSFSQ